MASYIRRLPVYLLLDCSGSMTGEPIEAVRQGVKALLDELRSDPQAMETAYLSVIQFASDAQQTVPLTELMLFQEPAISAGGATSMGEALEVLLDCANKEVRKSTADQKGDWRPLVFILTDGNPTDPDTFDRVAPIVKSSKFANIIACAAGSDVETKYLKKITDNVLLLNSLTPGALAEFFKWVSSSIKLSSKSVDASPAEGFSLPAPPAGFVVVP